MQDMKNRMTSANQFRDELVGAKRAGDFVISCPAPSGRVPVAAFLPASTPDGIPARDFTGEPRYEHQPAGRVEVPRQVFVRSLIDQQVASGFQDAPHFFNVGGSRLRDMFKHGIR